MLFQHAGRASARLAVSQSGGHCNRVALAQLGAARVNVASNSHYAPLGQLLHQSPSQTLSEARRQYATGAATAAAVAPARTAQPRAAPTKASGRRKASAKPKGATKAKPKRATKVKPKRAPLKAKRGKKKAAKPKKKVAPKRKILSAEQKAAAKKKKKLATIRELKALALKPPRAGRRTTAWMALFGETSRGKKGARAPEMAKEASTKYKNLSPKEMEHYNHIANQARNDGRVLYDGWLKATPPAAIYDANNARIRLRRMGFGRYPAIKDPRQVKKPMMARLEFMKERYDSGDMKGIKAVEAMKLIQREWDGLPDTQKKRYYEMEIRSREQYVRDVKAVYNRDVTLSSDTKATLFLEEVA